MLSITEKAERHLINIIDKNPDKVIRIAVEGGGCHGYKYGFWLEDNKNIGQEDILISKDSYAIVLDAQSSSLLNEAILDFEDKFLMGELKIKNPNAKTSCGCGNSFSL